MNVVTTEQTTVVTTLHSYYHTSLGFNPNTSFLLAVEQVTSSSNFSSKLLSIALEEEESNKSSLMKWLYDIFSSYDKLNHSFLSITNKDNFGVDVAQVTSVFERLYGLNNSGITNTINNALETLFVNTSWSICTSWNDESYLRLFIIMLHHPSLLDPDFRRVLGGVCKLFFFTPRKIQQLLKELWMMNNNSDKLKYYVNMLQQYMCIRLYSGENLDTVFAAAHLLSLLHEVNSVKKFCNATDFYNDVVNSDINLIKDYTQSTLFKKRQAEMEEEQHRIFPTLLGEMAFCSFPFLLDASSKARILQLDSSVSQQLINNTRNSRQYLVLRVRRDNIIQDTLSCLASISDTNEFKKQLRIEFVGEEGIDEGGLSKEFFQLVLKELLNPNYGMFLTSSDYRWFNSSSHESLIEFELIGTIVGLAVYNSVVLDLRFPPVFYQKLLNTTTSNNYSLSDLAELKPELARGLQSLLDYKNDDFTQVFNLNFQINKSVYGETRTIDLISNGDNVVTLENRESYVNAYVTYELDTDIATQFNAFVKGFNRALACSKDALSLFTPLELERTIVGCDIDDLDFTILRRVVHYEDGYTSESSVISFLWNVLEEFDLELKKKFLHFTTGSDRIPIKGLESLTLVISRHTDDDTRLPSAHTCFNHLLLPEYKTQSQLKDRLLLAITQCSHGFGLL